MASVASPGVLTSDEFATVSFLLSRIGVSCDDDTTISQAIEILNRLLACSTKRTVARSVAKLDPMLYITVDLPDRLRMSLRPLINICK